MKVNYDQETDTIAITFRDERTKASGTSAMTPQQKADLFDQFRLWQEGKTR